MFAHDLKITFQQVTLAGTRLAKHSKIRKILEKAPKYYCFHDAFEKLIKYIQGIPFSKYLIKANYYSHSK